MAEEIEVSVEERAEFEAEVVEEVATMETEDEADEVALDGRVWRGEYFFGYLRGPTGRGYESELVLIDVDNGQPSQF